MSENLVTSRTPADEPAFIHEIPTKLSCSSFNSGQIKNRFLSLYRDRKKENDKWVIVYSSRYLHA